MIVRRGALLVAATLALMSLGLPWGTTPRVEGMVIHGPAIDTYVPGFGGEAVLGRQHAVRLIGAIAALLVVVGVRRSRHALVAVGVLVAAGALPVDGFDGSGRVVYALAIAVVMLGRRPASELRTAGPRTPAPT